MSDSLRFKLEIDEEMFQAVAGQIEAYIPAGCKELYRKDNDTTHVKRTFSGATLEMARQKFQEFSLPHGAKDVTVKEEPPKETTLTLKADSKEEARQMAETSAERGMKLTSLQLVEAGRKGFLGMGRTPNQYQAVLNKPAEVELGFNPPSGAVFDLEGDPSAETPKAWADSRVAAGDYRALVAVVQDPGKEEHEWRKSWIARVYLKRAGAAAVDAMVEGLESEPGGEESLAKILVELGAQQAVGVISLLLLKGTFDAFSGYHGKDWYQEFVDRYPELKRAEPSGTCALCGKPVPVSGMRTYRLEQKDITFCKEKCWSERGSVIGSTAGKDCPHYANYICRLGSGGHLCALQSGSYQECFMYKSFYR